MWLCPSKLIICNEDTMFINRPINIDHILTYDIVHDVPIDNNQNDTSSSHFMHEQINQGNHTSSIHPLLGKFPAIVFVSVNNNLKLYWFFADKESCEAELKKIDEMLFKANK
jgi:hypothetical protein